MARILTCGFETQNLVEMTAQNHNFSTSITRSAGGVSAQLAATAHTFYQEDPNGWDEIFVRFACYLPALSSVQRFALTTVGGATAVIALLYGGGTAITVNVKGAALAVTPVAIPANTWHLVELHVKVEGVAGLIELKQNNVMTLLYRGAIGPLQRFGRATWEPGGVTTAQYYDDLAINDISGPVDTSWPGDGYVIRALPSGNGSASQWQGQDGDSVDNYLLVDERPNDGETTTIKGWYEGQTDLYAHSAITLGTNVVKRVFLSGYARQFTVGVPDLFFGIKQAGQKSWADASDYLNPATTLTYRRTTDWLVNPLTGQPFTQADLNALEMGVHV